MYSLLSGVYLFPPVKAFIRPTSCLFLVDCFESTADININISEQKNKITTVTKRILLKKDL